VIGRRLHRAGQGAAWLAALSLALAPPAFAAPAQTPAAVGEDDDAALYRPADEDERGLWLQMDDYERDRKNSPLVVQDEELNDYVRGVLCRTVGQAKCRNVRLYIIRTPYFNASMAPNGMMEVWSGLLLRMENEAQLATVLGHEYSHFEQRHSLRLFREAKEKSNAASWISFIPFGFLAGLGLIGSIYKFSREMEHDADMGGLDFVARAGYDTRECAVIWERLREEMDATAQARDTKSRKDKDGGLFASHPPSRERVEDLRKAAAANPGTPGNDGAARYRAALAHIWPEFVDDQLKMNDFGASDFLLQNLGRDGWTPELLYARGELYRRQGTPDALEKAAGFYSEAIEGGAQIAAAWRGRGLTRLKLGQAEAGRADLGEYLRRAPDAADRAMMAMMAGGQ